MLDVRRQILDIGCLGLLVGSERMEGGWVVKWVSGWGMKVLKIGWIICVL